MGDAPGVFNDHKLRDLKREARLRKEAKEKRLRDAEAVLGLATTGYLESKRPYEPPSPDARRHGHRSSRDRRGSTTSTESAVSFGHWQRAVRHEPPAAEAPAPAQPPTTFGDGFVAGRSRNPKRASTIGVYHRASVMPQEAVYKAHTQERGSMIAIGQDTRARLGSLRRGSGRRSTAKRKKPRGHTKVDIDFEETERSIRRLQRERALAAMRVWWDEDQEDIEEHERQMRRSRSLPEVRGRPKPPVGGLDVEEPWYDCLDDDEVEDKIEEMLASRELQGVGLDEGRPTYAGAGATAARAELATRRDVPLPSGRRHRELRKRVYRLRKAFRDDQVKRLGPAELLIDHLPDSARRPTGLRNSPKNSPRRSGARCAFASQRLVPAQAGPVGFGRRRDVFDEGGRAGRSASSGRHASPRRLGRRRAFGPVPDT